MSPHGPALHLHRQIITALLQKAGTPYSSQDLRNIMDSVDGGNADFRTKLTGGKNRVPSLKIPRQNICQDLLKEIDGCKYYQVTGYNFLVEFSPSSMNLRNVVLKFCRVWRRVHRGYRRRKRDLVTSNLHKLCNITGQSHTTRRVVWMCREGISHQNCTTKRGIEIGEELKWDPERTIPCHEEKPFSVKGSWRITGREGNWGSIHDGIGFHFVSSPHIP